MKSPACLCTLLRAGILFATVNFSLAAGPLPSSSNQSWQYSLLPGSQIFENCFCPRPQLPVPLQGTFRLRLLEGNSLGTRFAVEEIVFTGGSTNSQYYRVLGHGTYAKTTSPPYSQTLLLEMQINNGFTNTLCYLTNTSLTVQRLWPMLMIEVKQTNGTTSQEYDLDWFAAPLSDIWFSTAHGLTAGIWNWPTNQFSAGDLFSYSGRVIKFNKDLTAQLGFMPMVPDLGLDALHLLPGGEIAFSINGDMFSGTLGQVQNGDVLSDRGRVIARQANLLAPFMPPPPVADNGLDALQIANDGEIFFSVTNDFFSGSLGRTVPHGDLLSSRGVIVKSNSELLVRFQPADPKPDYGLDAVFVWPSGEIWFSVATGFYGQHFEYYAPGDLLSDQGYVVYENLHLVGAFQPLEDLADFGLDAFFIVSDALSATNAPPRCTNMQWNTATGNIILQWDAQGRLFQLEKATDILGPYRPISLLSLTPQFVDPGAITNQAHSFYRLRQW